MSKPRSVVAPNTFTQVATGVFVTTSIKYATNSTVLVSGSDVILVDPSWEPAELSGIADWLDHCGLGVVAGFATHAHHDHVLWHPRFGEAPRWAGAAAVDLAAAHRSELIDRLGASWPTELADLVGLLTPAPPGHLPWDGFPVELVTHDAHAGGHTALWLPEQRTLLAGDMLSDIELPLAEETGMGDYRAGLESLSPFVSRAQVLIPGHGSPAVEANEPGSVAARLDADQKYWLDLLNTGNSADPRIVLPEMAQAHEHNQNLARRYPY